eukprot:CAMPEP_0202692632 /NCGR_PEP_ID=MMETSP1385-20130828/6965_1 /ASSEMBLY_ACC=CAM_ASM_000861 /TAXON_ID=933848 /ORGANISM="Elphidium margaritaceum" /LENGTH=437 /DNA_ID=CAMNT_0049348205 /DNA_START=16 /DNA_END=1329 /DNA_ORIENTATION=-
MSKVDLNDESKTSTAAPSFEKPSLRFTSINSINQYITHHENVLQFAEQQIASIVAKSTLLNDAFRYEFDIFEFANYTNRPLLVLGVYLLKNSDRFASLFASNKVDLLACAHFLDLCDKLYQKNPYHNNIHATDVMQFNMVLLSSKFCAKYFTDYELLTAFMSAAAHDIGHIGKNNDFLVKTSHALAQRFNNVSCLENYHIEQFHQTITDNSRANWIKNFDDETQHYIIDLVEYAIIGTDMGVYHNTIKATLKETYNAEFMDKLNTSASSSLSVEQKQFIIRAMLHMSDISNPMRTFPVCRQWATRVNDEFFAQGDVMRTMSVEISPGCDRTKCDLLKNQNGFVTYCVLPLATSLSVLIDELQWCLQSTQNNRKKWQQEPQTKQSDEVSSNDASQNEKLVKRKSGNSGKIPQSPSVDSTPASPTTASSFNSNQSEESI